MEYGNWGRGKPYHALLLRGKQLRELEERFEARDR
jgi:hypothetical protein